MIWTRKKIVAVWIVGWMLTWPALLADLNEHQFYQPNQQIEFRKDLGVAMFFAAFPPMWVTAPLVTGFYEHGFRFWRKPE